MNSLNVFVIGGSGGIGAELIRQYQQWSVSSGSRCKFLRPTKAKAAARFECELDALGSA